MFASLLMGVLPKLALDIFGDWQKNRALAEGSKENTKREVSLALIAAEKDRRKTRSDERKKAFEFPLFWYPWMAAAIPWSIWLGLGILDSIAILDFLPLTVHALPPQLDRVSDAISVSLFGTGGVVQLGQGALRVMAGRQK